MKNKVLFITLLFLFGIFLVLYIGQATGYNEYKNSKKTIMTNESIKRFENDLKSGKDININNYKVEEKVNSNKLSNSVLHTSRFLEKGVNKVIVYIFKKLSTVIEDS